MGILAGKADFNVQGGSTWTESTVYKDANGTAIDLTSWSARMQIRAKIDDVTPLLTLTDAAASPNPRLTLGGVLGTLGITVEAVGTASLVNGNADTKLVYGIELYKTVGGVEKVIPYLMGAINVSAEVVR